MNEYHKINSLFKRDAANKNRMIFGEYADPTFEMLANIPWRLTEKIDGMNIRAKWFAADSRIEFAGRTDNASIHPQLIERLRELFPVDVLARHFDQDTCFYGEGYGNGIQKGGYYSDEKDFALFDVKIGDCWLRRESVEEIAANMNIVAVTEYTGYYTLPEMVEFVCYMRPQPGAHGEYLPEGVVARPKVDLFDRQGRRVVTKLKVRDFVI